MQEIEVVIKFLQEKPGYLKESKSRLSKKLNIDEDICLQALSKLRKNKDTKIFITPIIKEITEIDIPSTVAYLVGEGKFAEAARLLSSVKDKYSENSRILVIGDLHCPFENKEYLEFCKKKYDEFKCNKVIFIGDIIDNHYSSFHPSDPDGFGAGEELERAIDCVKLWYEAFPNAIVIIGNHDRLAYRKAFAGGISSRWIRSYNEVLNTPNWEFVEQVIVDNVMYVHGEGGTARTKFKEIGMSVVQGHLHSQAYIEFNSNRFFSVQVGTGIDNSAYAFNYGKAGKESILSCAIILEGTQPYLCKM